MAQHRSGNYASPMRPTLVAMMESSDDIYPYFGVRQWFYYDFNSLVNAYGISYNSTDEIPLT